MKTFQITIISLLVASASLLNSCKKDKKTEEPTPTPAATVEKGSVTVNLAHKWGFSNEKTFELGKVLTHPMSNDALNFTTFKYYISNVKLKKADGTWFVEPESYHLVNIADANSLSIALSDVPTGDYTDVYFTMGVDSARNVSGAQSGALATSNGMFWSWNSGYIMVKAEGTSTNSTSGSFAFHLGGFSGANNIVTEKHVTFDANNLTVSANKKSEAFLNVNPGWLWHSAPSVATLNTIMMPGTNAKTMANGFFTNNSFTLDHIVE